MARTLTHGFVAYVKQRSTTPVEGAPIGSVCLTDTGTLTHRYGSTAGLTACGRIAARVFTALQLDSVTCQQCSGGDWTATYTTRIKR